MQSYDESRPTATLPGSLGTVSGTAVNDWLDDDGKPIYGGAMASGNREPVSPSSGRCLLWLV